MLDLSIICFHIPILCGVCLDKIDAYNPQLTHYMYMNMACVYMCVTKGTLAIQSLWLPSASTCVRPVILCHSISGCVHGLQPLSVLTPNPVHPRSIGIGCCNSHIHFSNFEAIGRIQAHITPLRVFARSGGKTSNRQMRRGPVFVFLWTCIGQKTTLDYSMIGSTSLCVCPS